MPPTSKNVLPIRASSEDEGDFGVTWLEPPPSSDETSLAIRKRMTIQNCRRQRTFTRASIVRGAISETKGPKSISTRMRHCTSRFRRLAKAFASAGQAVETYTGQTRAIPPQTQAEPGVSNHVQSAVPFAIATCLFHPGIDPFTGQEVYVAKGLKDRKMQRAV